MPPNQFAQVMSRTPATVLIVSACVVGIEKIKDVDRIVTMRVEELASTAAWNPSSTARSAANRNTAIATLMTVSAVRRMFRRALLTTRPANFIRLFPPDLPDLPARLGLFDQRTFLEVQQMARALGGVR